MTVWFSSPATTPTHTAPSEDLARFVGRTYGACPRHELIFLDIGSGSGANAKWLRDNSYPTITLDSSPLAKPDICDDVSRISEWHSEFDCIIDINTLCHVEVPPYAAIHEALKPHGKFFSLTPAVDTQAEFGGKGYTHKSTWVELHSKLAAFRWINIAPANYPSDGRNIAYWVIEATK